METFIEVKELSENPNYLSQREAKLGGLSDAVIDAPITDLVNGLNRLPHCFTLQSCFGHFVYKGQEMPHNLVPLPLSDPPARVEYRIAYLAVCIENSTSGRALLNALAMVPSIDPETVQWGCATWFWKRQINSYVLQVEPMRFKYSDTAMVSFEEARHIEMIRNDFYAKLFVLLERETKVHIG